MQQHDTHEVLMVGWMNDEALEKPWRSPGEALEKPWRSPGEALVRRTGWQVLLTKPYVRHAQPRQFLKAWVFTDPGVRKLTFPPDAIEFG
jgi:hypothetical protein